MIFLGGVWLDPKQGYQVSRLADCCLPADTKPSKVVTISYRRDERRDMWIPVSREVWHFNKKVEVAQVTTFDFLAVALFNRRLAVIRRLHFDKSKTFGFAAVLVTDNFG